MAKPLVVELKQTCSACPSQWEGSTDDGRCVYIRYRWGTLEVGIGETKGDAIDSRVDVCGHGGSLDGTMSTETMMSLARPLRFMHGIET